jgi:hypothetical protein
LSSPGSRRAKAAPAVPLGPLVDPIADQDRFSPGPLRRGGVLGRLRRGYCRDTESDQWSPYLDHVTRLAVGAAHHSGHRRGDLHQGLGRVHLDQRLVQLDLVARRDLPLHDLGVLESLAEVGKVEDAFGHGRTSTAIAHQYSRVRWTAARIRSTLGR